jgi:hypothetical protein
VENQVGKSMLVKSPSSNNENNNIYMNSEIVEELKSSPVHTSEPSSPNSVKLNANAVYMNIGIGEANNNVNSNNTSLAGTPLIPDTKENVSTPPITGSAKQREFSKNSNGNIFGFTRTFSMDPNRCYENLEPGLELKPLLLRNRYSRPEIFSKVELPSMDKSEPCTPTVANRKVNYIILDLDHTTQTIINNMNNNTDSCNNNNNNLCSSNNNSDENTSTCNEANDASAGLNGSLTNIHMSTSTSMTNGLLPPESPQKAALGYATIDFNKTVALSNSTTSNDLDNEGSRKTRHNSNVTAISTGRLHSNSISD